VARAARARALDERRGAEVLQAGAGGGQRLAAAAGASCRVHGEAVSDPHGVPSPGAGRDLQRLRVDGDDVGRHVAHGAARDVRHDVAVAHGHHGKRRVGGQPVRLVVAGGVVAHVVHVAEQEGHGAEAGQARPGPAKILVVRLLVALDVEERVSVPELDLAQGAGGNLRGLGVAHKQVAAGGCLAGHTGGTLLALGARGTGASVDAG